MTAPPAWLVSTCERLNRTRLLPGFVHDRWDRLFGGERQILTIFGIAVRPVTVGVLLGWEAVPTRWEDCQ